MKRVSVIALTCLMLLPASGFSQTRRTRARRGRASNSSSTADVRTTAAKRVADEIKVLSQFLYLLGGISREIEAADAAAQRNEASQAVVQQTEANKGKVKDSLRNIREGLDQLEIDFRGKAELQPYYEGLAGVAAGAAAAEDQAGANRFTAAGRSLLPVISRLTDVLLAMR